jgi:hypothetical protein
VPALAPAILDRMRDVFACTKCHSIYEITRLQQQPVLPPRCQVCFASFPPSELDDWLAYERAEPEWTVGEWLAGQTSQFSVPSPHQRFAAFAQRRVPTADWPLPSRSQNPFDSARASDER